MDELEDKVEDEDKGKKHKQEDWPFAKSRVELENANYNSMDYRIFSFNAFGEPEQKSRDDIKIIKFISESDQKKR